MSYTETLTLVIPANLYDIACAIGRALDPDVGGCESWGCKLQGDPPAVPEFYTMSTRCRPEFKAQALFLLQHPDSLFDVVSEDYARRWSDFTPPTLEDCEAFCFAAKEV